MPQPRADHMRTSLEHLPRPKQRELERIVKILFREFEAGVENLSLPDKQKLNIRMEKIILYGSYARGTDVKGYDYQSDFDILVVSSHEEMAKQTSWHDLVDEAIERIASLRTPVSLIVESLDHVNRRLKRGTPFFVEILNEGIELYSLSERQKLVASGNMPPDVRYRVAREHFDNWFPPSKSFLKHYKIAFEDEENNIAAFLLHQAVESAYHSVMLVLTGYSPSTHNVIRLYTLAKKLNLRLMEAFPKRGGKANKMFNLLQQAYVKGRYSKHYHITEDELTWLGTRAEALIKCVETICHEKLKELEKNTKK